jgi:phosphoenolpyruvate carboxylase
MNDEQLRAEIRWLGELLGQTIENLQGEHALQLVERIREKSKLRRNSDRQAEKELVEILKSSSPTDLMTVVRAFSIFFDLANLAEDRHRARVLRHREQESLNRPRSESIAAAVQTLKDQEISAERLGELLQRLQIEPVFTAHPTEAKRRSFREKIRDFREHLSALDHGNLSPRESEQMQNELKTDLALLWQSDFLRERRPTVLEELERSLFFFGNLWRVVPDLYRQMEQAVEQYFPEGSIEIPKFLQFGTWIGGDRDGNPNVTFQITEQAMTRLREFVLASHHQQSRLLRRRLSLSDHFAPLSNEVATQLVHSLDRWAALEPVFKPIAPAEGCRRYLRMIQWRLEQTQASPLLGDPVDGAYRDGAELAQDVQRLRDSISATPGGKLLRQPLDHWLIQINVFGFHAMRMDIRQDSEWYREVLDELFRRFSISESYLAESEQAKQRLLAEHSLSGQRIEGSGLSEKTRETLELFRLIARLIQRNQKAALGLHIISMTQHPSDVLAVLWLSKWAAQDVGLPAESSLLPIVPLFETIDDLRRSARSLDEILSNTRYRTAVQSDGDRQIVMIGYSDSTKDGGYVAAAWEQYQAQLAMSQVAARHGVRVTFFHGRGGALGRGGGPAARAVLSSPREIINGAMRVTEQGEVLSARYDDPQIASRHLEQIISATLLASLAPEMPIPDQWHRWMHEIAERGLRAYRDLVESPSFIDYFEQATPIAEIEQLPIGSRPARRAGKRTLNRLRAIPWVFSWTQNRHLLPGWYGIGSALAQFCEAHLTGLEHLRSMYRNWAFFEGVVENAALALAKADLSIGTHYAKLLPEEQRQPIWNKIESEHRTSCERILAIVERSSLLENIGWLRDSIEIRNPYVDPLNLAQVELLKQARTAEEETPESQQIAELLRMSIQGIAAGLRTTG